MRCDAPEGMRGAIGVPGRRRGSRLVSGALVVAIAALVMPAQTLGVGNALSGGSVTPTTGTIATAFTFSVAYASDQGFAASSVWADVAGTTVTLTLVSGTADDGTFGGSSTLPAGSWSVTFRADAVQGTDPTLAGPTLTVIGPTPTASPTPNPTSTPVPTPRPTRSPRPTIAPTVPPTPVPTSPPVSPPSVPPSGTGEPIATSSSTAAASSAASATASERPSSTPQASEADAPSPEASQEPDPAEDASTPPGSPWLFVGGGMSAIGAAILAGQWARRRRPRPARG